MHVVQDTGQAARDKRRRPKEKATLVGATPSLVLTWCRRLLCYSSCPQRGIGPGETGNGCPRALNLLVAGRVANKEAS